MCNYTIIETNYIASHQAKNNLLFQVSRAGCGYQNKQFKIVRQKDYAFYTIHLLLDGCELFHIGEHDYLLKKGDAFIITPGEEHMYYNNSETSLGLLWVEFYGGNCNELFSYFRMNKIHILENHQTEQMQTQLIALLNYLEQAESINEFELSAKIYTFIMCLMEATTQIPQTKYSILISSALFYINEHFTSTINIPDLATSLHISHTYLTKLFRQHIGVPPRKYINLKRIEYACLLLTSTSLSCEAISEKIGMYDTAYFYKVFKATQGITPAQYRKNQTFIKTSFPNPQIGHTQSSGISSNAVPGAIPPSASPSSGS